MDSNRINLQCFALTVLLVCYVRATAIPAAKPASSERFLDLNSLFGQYPNNNRPYYGAPGSGAYPNYGGGGYPNAGYPNSGYPNVGYPNTGYPSVGGYPNSGYPSVGGGYPGGAYPGAGYPTVGGGYPAAGGGYPGYGTNMLGGGNGGYGGFGGNGGLPSYFGYNSNNYYGNRNNGFGYYKDTSSEGLSQRSDVRDGSHGHRGYN